jgi:5-methylcytosine-specific restriction endonuclease McrA
MGHWLGRKFRLTMPEVMRQFRRDNTYAIDAILLVKPTVYHSLPYREPLFKPNPYLIVANTFRREELPNDIHWTGYATRPGLADLQPLIIECDEYKCQLCGKPITPDTWAVDHIRPVRRFKRPTDANAPWNLWTLCKPCHEGKTKADRQRESRVR